jgi:hypothetical protein
MGEFLEGDIKSPRQLSHPDVKPKDQNKRCPSLLLVPSSAI